MEDNFLYNEGHKGGMVETTSTRHQPLTPLKSEENPTYHSKNTSMFYSRESELLDCHCRLIGVIHHHHLFTTHWVQHPLHCVGTRFLWPLPSTFPW